MATRFSGRLGDDGDTSDDSSPLLSTGGLGLAAFSLIGLIIVIEIFDTLKLGVTTSPKILPHLGSFSL